MRRLYVLIVAISLLAMIGCGKRDGIVGHWTATQPNPSGGTLETDMKFNSDHTYTTMTGAGDGGYEVTGTYTFDKKTNELSMTPVKMKLGGRETDAPTGTNAATKIPVSWTNDNEVVVGIMTLKRK